MTTDVLSDVLSAVRLTGAVYFDFDLSAPWVAEAPPSHEIAAVVMPGAQRVIEYHLIAAGTAWGHALGKPPIPLRQGDLLIFPQGDPHVLSSEPGMRAAPDLKVYARGSTPLPLVYEVGGGGAAHTRVICGFFGCDERPYNPLLAALPPMIHLAASTRSETWETVDLMMKMALRESAGRTPGGENMLARISELMFVEAIRRYLVTLPATDRGWLAGLRDPVVGRALEALHAAPTRTWTVESLGRQVGVSRSVLAARFTEMVGQPPIQYLALWRMQLAGRLLHDGQAVATVAGAVGYESEAAFSRTFKRIVGEAPGTWRRTGAPATRSASGLAT